MTDGDRLWQMVTNLLDEEYFVSYSSMRLIKYGVFQHKIVITFVRIEQF